MSYLLFTDIDDLADSNQTKNFIAINYDSENPESESVNSDKLSRDGESGVESHESCCVTEEEMIALAEA